MSRENILKHLYILYDPGDGLDYFDTEEAALQHARSISIEYLDGDGWSEDVEGIYVAKVIHHGRLRNTGEFFEFEMVPCRDKASADIATLESLRAENAELLAACEKAQELYDLHQILEYGCGGTSEELAATKRIEEINQQINQAVKNAKGES